MELQGTTIRSFPHPCGGLKLQTQQYRIQMITAAMYTPSHFLHTAIPSHQSLRGRVQQSQRNTHKNVTMWPVLFFDMLFFSKEQKTWILLNFWFNIIFFLPLSPQVLKMYFVNAHSENLFGSVSARIHTIYPVSKDRVLHAPTHYVWYIKEATSFFFSASWLMMCKQKLCL